jgi:hypothetical protein
MLMCKKEQCDRSKKHAARQERMLEGAAALHFLSYTLIMMVHPSHKLKASTTPGVQASSAHLWTVRRGCQREDTKIIMYVCFCCGMIE